MKAVIHHLTNHVSMHLQANACYAYGSTPLMTSYSPEFEALYQQVDSLLINLGTPSHDKLEAIHTALLYAQQYQLPICLDAVGVHLSPQRQEMVTQILKTCPISVLKGNWAEICCLLGGQSHFKGLDAITRPADIETCLKEWDAPLKQLLTRVDVIVITGVHDFIIAKGQWAEIESPAPTGHYDPIIQNQSGIGCLCGSLIACNLGQGLCPFDASQIALRDLKDALYQVVSSHPSSMGFESHLLSALTSLAQKHI